MEWKFPQESFLEISIQNDICLYTLHTHTTTVQTNSYITNLRTVYNNYNA